MLVFQNVVSHDFSTISFNLINHVQFIYSPHNGTHLISPSALNTLRRNLQGMLDEVRDATSTACRGPSEASPLLFHHATF